MHELGPRWHMAGRCVALPAGLAARLARPRPDGSGPPWDSSWDSVHEARSTCWGHLPRNSATPLGVECTPWVRQAVCGDATGRTTPSAPAGAVLPPTGRARNLSLIPVSHPWGAPHLLTHGLSEQIGNFRSISRARTAISAGRAACPAFGHVARSAPCTMPDNGKSGTAATPARWHARCSMRWRGRSRRERRQ